MKSDEIEVFQPGLTTSPIGLITPDAESDINIKEFGVSHTTFLLKKLKEIF
jgi:hypothetical protein